VDEPPFIHALDTVRGRAFCVDLDDIPYADSTWLRIVAPQDGPIRVVRRGRTVALVDRRTFEVSSPPAARPARSALGGGGGTGAVVPLAGLGLLVAVAAARRRYARSASFRNAS
jgi:hypothetical protein